MKKKIKKLNKKTHSRPSSKASVEASVEAKPPGNTRVASVDYEEFVRLWTKAASVSEVANAFNIKTTSASAIANRLRKEGIELRRFPRRGARIIDVKKLNRIATGKAD